MAYDPICGRKVSENGAPNAEYRKRRYHFCSDGCRTEFQRAAERVRMRDAARAGALMTHGRVKWGVA